MNEMPPTPLAVPFRIDHFRFRRQAELEHQLGESRLLQELRKVAGADYADRKFRTERQESMLLPPGFMPELDEAVRRFHTLARLSYPLEMRLWPVGRETAVCRAHRAGRTLVMVWSGAALERCSVPELVCHLAVGTYYALDIPVRTPMILLAVEAPVSWSERMALLEACRLRRYAASCFARVCTQAPELVVREDFRRSTGFPAAGLALDFSRLAEHHLQEQDLTTERLVNEGLQESHCHPLLGTVLEHFDASAGYHACLGLPGGTPREQFEAEVLALDRQMHPPLTGQPAAHRSFVQQATVLATYHVMEHFAPVTPARRQMFLDFHGLDEAGLAQAAAACEWDPEQPQQAEARLWSLLRGQRVWANVHSAEVLGRALEWTRREHGGMPESLAAVLSRFAEWCRVSGDELQAIDEALRAEGASVQDKPKPSAEA